MHRGTELGGRMLGVRPECPAGGAGGARGAGAEGSPVASSAPAPHVTHSVQGGSPGQEYWSGLPLLSAGDLPNPGIELRSPVLQADSFPSELPGKS